MTGLKINKIFKSEVVYHIIFWTIHLIFRLYLRGYFQNLDVEKLYEEFFSLPVRMFGAYLTIHLFKKYLFNKEYLKFFTLLPISILLVLFIRRLVGYYFIGPMFNPNYVQIDLVNINSIISYIVYTYPVITTAVVITILRKWFNDQEIKRKLEKENLKAQLNLLKGQIQPHFLFNTLNNIYSMSVDNSTHTSESILKLSDLLDYMLYKTNTPVVNLPDEIKHLNDYIDLEKLRYGNRLEVIFNVTGDIKDITLAPLLFLPILENCFKHGASKTIENAWISIDISVKNDKLTAKFENSKNENIQVKWKDGIGLSNVKKRLGLLYKDNYELKIMEEKDSFLVILKLNTTHKPMLISL